MGFQILTTPPVGPNIPRADPVHPKTAFPMQTERYVPRVTYEEAPLPPKDTAFSGVGRDVGHAPTPINRFRSLAIPEYAINGVIGWPFNVPKVSSALVVSQPRGRFNAIRNRTNINMPKQVSLGEQTSQAVLYSYEPALAKLT